MIIQGVDRPNTTPIGQDRKYKDLQSLSLTSTSLRDIPFLYEPDQRSTLLHNATLFQ